MKKVLLFILALCLCSTAHAQEALMWTSQSDPTIYAAEGYRETATTYANPKQYLLQLRPLNFPASLDAMCSSNYGPISIGQDDHALEIIPSHPYFGREANQVLAPVLPGEDNLPVSFCMADEPPIVPQLRTLLKNVGWSDACDPDMFCTGSQVVERGTNPIERGLYYVDSIPQELWDNFYYLHFMQCIDGYPLAIWVEGANEDEYETRDANFVLDEQGRIVAGRIFPGYEIVGQADLPAKTLTTYEAGERVLQIMLSQYDWTKTWDGLQAYECSWEVTGFTPGLVLTHSGVALPCWHVAYRMTMLNTLTGEQTQIDRIYPINALTGAG